MILTLPIPYTFLPGVATFLASSRDALVAAKSRFHETEADDIGCKLAAMSCYDTKRGSEVFRKMQLEDEANGKVKNDFMATHPTSEERYRILQELTETQNYAQYRYCNTLSKRINRLISKSNY